MEIKSTIKKWIVRVCAFVVGCAAFGGAIDVAKSVSASVEANSFDGMTWKNISDMMILPTDGTLAVDQNSAAYNTTPVGTYDENANTYTVSVEVTFNMETYNANHTQIFIMPSIVNFSTTISGKFGSASSTLLGARAYYADETSYNSNTMLVRITDSANYRTNVSFGNIKHDGTDSHVFTWIITETSVTMQFDGTDLCANGSSTPYAMVKSDGTAWTLADFTDNGEPKAYFGVYNTAWMPLEIHNAGEAPEVEKEQTVTFDGVKSRTWDGTGFVYPDENGRINNSWYSEQNIAQNYDETTKTLKVSVEMSFVQTAFNSGQVVVWLSPMTITDWNTQVDGGLGATGSQLLHLRMYYQSQSLYDGNSLLVRAGDYGNYKTSNNLLVKHDGSTTHIITWIITETSVTMQFDGVALCASGSSTPYTMMKDASTAWTLADFMDENNQPQAYFGEMNSGGFGNAYVHNVDKGDCWQVTFMLDNGETDIVRDVYDDTPVVLPQNPEKQSTEAGYVYTFSHWSLNGQPYDVSAAVTDDMTLKAEYTYQPVTYTATVVHTDGSETYVLYTVENRAEKLAELLALLPDATDEYYYGFEEGSPEELPLQDGATYTIVKVEENYTVTVVYYGKTAEQVSYNALTRAQVLADIAAAATADTVEYDYSIELPAELPLENGATYTEVRVAIVYTANIVKIDQTQESIEFTVENRTDKLEAIAAMLPVNDVEYVYGWTTELPVELALENGNTFTMQKTAVEYSVTVIKADGTEVVVTYTVENRRTKLEYVASLRPENDESYTYGWSEPLPVVLALENGKVYTVTKMPVDNGSSGKGCGGVVWSAGTGIVLCGFVVVIWRKKKDD